MIGTRRRRKTPQHAIDEAERRRKQEAFDAREQFHWLLFKIFATGFAVLFIVFFVSIW